VVVAARSIRRATAKRASRRRATARKRQVDLSTRLMNFIVRHPGSTVGDVAKGVGVDPGRVSARLTQLRKLGKVDKAPHGYTKVKVREE